MDEAEWRFSFGGVAGFGISDFHEDPKNALVFVPGVAGGSRSSWGVNNGDGKGDTGPVKECEVSDSIGDGVRAGGAAVGIFVTWSELAEAALKPQLGLGNPSHRLA